MEQFETLFNDSDIHFSRFNDNDFGCHVFPIEEASSTSGVPSPDSASPDEDAISGTGSDMHEFGMHDGFPSLDSFPHSTDMVVPICDFAREAAGAVVRPSGPAGPTLHSAPTPVASSTKRATVSTPRKASAKARTPVRAGSGVTKQQNTTAKSRKTSTTAKPEAGKNANTKKRRLQTKQPMPRPVARPMLQQPLTPRTPFVPSSTLAVDASILPAASVVTSSAVVDGRGGQKSIVCVVRKTAGGPAQEIRCVVSGTSLAVNPSQLAAPAPICA